MRGEASSAIADARIDAARENLTYPNFGAKEVGCLRIGNRDTQCPGFLVESLYSSTGTGIMRE
jgi:hypothetical protein